MTNDSFDYSSKKLAMQIVPYMPIHPAQLNIPIEKEEDIELDEEKHLDSPAPILANPKPDYDDDDDLFKKPFAPTPYIVEEPPDSFVKRSTRMKRFVNELMIFIQCIHSRLQSIEVILSLFVRIAIYP